MKLKRFFQIALAGNFLLTLYFFFQQGINSGVELPHFDKVGHFIAFFMLTLCVDFATSFKRLTVASMLIIYGISVEFIQSYIPGREASLADIVADTAGVLTYYLVIIKSELLKRFRTKAHDCSP